ncbi:hypothetical protein Taro_035088 [Colocasia esculenta]|uniref:Uncharacterized protein n=1 Tax=Colocasia esculenta TaxID=4460 RepID=A0A843VY38_COLES|nr:hypothetical protein [Colocasia esculenta]
MFSSTDPPYPFDVGSLHGHHEAICLPLLQSKPDPSTLSPFLPPAAFDHGGPGDGTFADHLLSTTLRASLLPTQQKEYPWSANYKSMAAAANSPSGFYGTRKKSVGVSECKVAGSCSSGRARRKDGHSKINTAQGPRDRRMRLSLDVARRFFGLQDLLGFDKASSTVEWLLTKSITAIKDLTGCSPSPPARSDVGDAKFESASTSECEVISISTTENPPAPDVAQQVNVVLPRRVKKAAARPSRKAAALPALAKETRLVARARARERTREKLRCLGGLHDGGQEVQLLPWSSPLQVEEVLQPRTIHGINSFPAEMVAAAALGEQALINSSYLPEQPYMRTILEDCQAYTPTVITTGGSDQIPAVFGYTNNDIALHGSSGAAGSYQEQTLGNLEDPRVILGAAQQQHARHWVSFDTSCI